MKNNGKEIKPEATKSGTSQQQENTLFSAKEVKVIVKDFVAAFISGQVKINFPDSKSIFDLRKEKGEKTTSEEACKQMLEIKTYFLKNVGICAGTTKATPEEQEKALNEVFSDLIAYRISNRIDGVFIEYALEARIKRLEEGIDKVNNLVKEIVEWIMNQVVDK